MTDLFRLINAQFLKWKTTNENLKHTCRCFVSFYIWTDLTWLSMRICRKFLNVVINNRAARKFLTS
jgi:hypothetical protein